jgi:hypothetical protein
MAGTEEARGIMDFPRRASLATERGGGRPVGHNGTRGPQGSGAERESRRSGFVMRVGCSLTVLVR